MDSSGCVLRAWVLSTEDGGTGNLQTHKPLGFLQTVYFSMNATAPRNWLGILTQ